MTDETSLAEALQHLSPWHLRVQVSVSTWTNSAETSRRDELGSVSFIDDRDRFRRIMLSLFQHGLEGKSMLDVACNCGAYLFWAQELGAGRCVGFDARQHWIDQAAFLSKNRSVGPPRRPEFSRETTDEFFGRSTEMFDIVQLKGILYHVADPIQLLREAASRTRDLLIVDTGIRYRFGFSGFSMGAEDPNMAMNGLAPLNWYPTSLDVVGAVLAHYGLTSQRTLYFSRVPRPSAQAGALAYIKRLVQLTQRGALAAAPSDATFSDFDRAAPRTLQSDD